jgi:hypothetical protein
VWLIALYAFTPLIRVFEFFRKTGNVFFLSVWYNSPVATKDHRGERAKWTIG